MEDNVARRIAVYNQNTIAEIRLVALGKVDDVYKISTNKERLNVIKGLICKAENYSKKATAYFSEK